MTLATYSYSKYLVLDVAHMEVSWSCLIATRQGAAFRRNKADRIACDIGGIVEAFMTGALAASWRCEKWDRNLRWCQRVVGCRRRLK